ncbi:MAG: glycine cleavage system protein GcvH [Eubacteriales bacterium]|nr:glycine cleavage system protein GcvH [Eubacteriales bacterium]
MNFPTDRKYTKSHEWIMKDGDLYAIGITEYAQSELGDVVFINLPNVDDEVFLDEAFADVESVKAVSDILSPSNGVVAEVNEELLDAPEKLNEAPYEAWIVKISDVGELPEFLSADEYAAFLEEEQ